MWDGLFVLLFLCFLMATASFLAGMLPLYFYLSTRKMRLITALGTGVLVGTCLIVIIPEGVETLYSASGSSHSHGSRSTGRLVVGKTFVDRIAEEGSFPGSLKHDTWRRDDIAVPTYGGSSVDGGPGVQVGGEGRIDVAEATTEQEQEKKAEDEAGQQPDNSEDNSGDDNEPEDEEDSSRDPHAWVGISLITGFILMYLIDTLPRQATTASQPQRFHISLNNLSFNRSSSVTSTTGELPTPSAASHNRDSSRPSSTTVGLVIHACADGIALGASSTTTSRLSFIIFVALMIHKAPAAFGLTSVLLKQGLSKRAARAHLIVFSLAAPIGALLTWGAAHLLGYSSRALSHSMSTEFATGILLLFSGGTFLYVAMHTMQSSEHDHGNEAQGNGYVGVPMMDMYDGQPSRTGQKRDGKEGFTDTMVCVGGMLIPLLTQFGHAH